MDRNIGAGARPRHRGGRGRGRRGPNPLNNPQHGGEEPERKQHQRPQQQNLGCDTSRMRDIAYIIGPVLSQRAAICWAIVFARLVEAAYNISLDEETKSFIEISINDLVKKIKKDTKDMEIGSLKKCFKIIRFQGLAKKSPTSVQNDELAPKITWIFGSEENADMTFIVTKLNSSPVGIIIEIDDEFQALREGIYKVRRVQPDSEGQILRHALMITGHGRTPNERHFLITQNSWDTIWGVKGYGRIAIEDDMRCLVFYPTF